MKLLGVALSGANLKFISARYVGGSVSAGTVVCETQEQCDAVATWAALEGWNLETRLATSDEVADFNYWKERM